MIRDVDPQQQAAAKDLRKSLSIPKSALVVCRSGGKETFDVPFVHSAVSKLARKYSREELVFLFLNTNTFLGSSNPNIHFLPFTVDVMEKENFMKTCDTFLHARSGGETFGMSILF